MLTPHTIVICPGQGGFAPAQWRDLAARPQLRPTLEDMDRATRDELGIDLLTCLDEDRTPAELAVQAPALLQLLIHANSVLAGTWELQLSCTRPDLLMGHSLGEIAALALGGAFTHEQGMRIVCRRTAALLEHNPDGGAMLAVGVSAERTTAAIRLLALDDSLVIAGTNASDRTVLSGTADAIGAAAQLFRQVGLVTSAVPSPWAFHHPMLADAARTFRTSLAPLAAAPLKVPVYSPVLQREYRTGEDLSESLAQHFTIPFSFGEALTQAALRTRSGEVVAAGGGGVITALARRIVDSEWTVREIDLDAVDVARDLAVETWLLNLLTGARNLADDAQDRAFRQFWETEGRDEFIALARRAAAGAGHDVVKFAITNDTATSGAAAPGSLGPASNGLGLSPMPPAHAAPAGTPTPASPVDRDGVITRLAALYAEALEYPEEVFTDEPHVQLEADLGVDSVKQTDLLARAAAQFDIPIPEDGFSVAGYPTFESVVDLIAGVARGGDGPGLRVPTTDRTLALADVSPGGHA